LELINLPREFIILARVGLMADTVNTHQNRSSKNLKGQSISIWKIFSYADFVDVSMMVLGTLGSIADGSISTAGVSVMMSGLMNTLGSDPPAISCIE
jgi:hypothetical protein